MNLQYNYTSLKIILLFLELKKMKNTQSGNRYNRLTSNINIRS